MFSPVIRCRDLHSPFGQKHTAPCDAHRVGFTGKERDGETGFDYFGARFYAPIPGRFLSPDPLLDSADPADPQSWNRYSYALNNPLSFVDPDGREPQQAEQAQETEEQRNQPAEGGLIVDPASIILEGVNLLSTFARELQEADPLTQLKFFAMVLAGIAVIDQAGEELRDPFSIRFTQDSISENFSDGRPVSEIAYSGEIGRLFRRRRPPRSEATLSWVHGQSSGRFESSLG